MLNAACNTRPLTIVSFLANLVLVAAMLPFVAVMPVFSSGAYRSDVQPTGAVIAILVIMILMVTTPKTLTLTRIDLLLFLAGIFSLIYINWGSTDFDLVWLRRTGQILMGFPVYYAVRNLYNYMSPRIFVFVVAAYLAVILLQLFALPVYDTIAPIILSEVRSSIESTRTGIAGLAQEPSQMATLAFFFILAPVIFKRDFWVTHRKAYWFVIFASVIMLVLSRCATGVFLMIVLLLAWLFLVSRGLTRRKFILSVVLLLLVLSARSFDLPVASRWGTYALVVARNPLYFIQDPSLAMRQSGLYIGLINLPRIPFGTASVAIDYGLIDQAWLSPLMDWLVPYERPAVYAYSMGFYQQPGGVFIGGGISLLGHSIQRMGIFYLLILAFICWQLRGPRESVLFKILFLAFLTNGPIAMSVIWLMLGWFVALRQYEHATTMPGLAMNREGRAAPAGSA